jgi:L-serine kinase (ATP) / ParB family transcriptional regulator, heme-responsive regulator
LIGALKNLRLIALESLLLHEAHDEARLARLAERVQAEGMQRNPVIVAPHGDSYLVLDGAHRFSTLKELGCRLILVQVADMPDEVESWGHLLDERSVRQMPDSPQVEPVGTPENGYLAELEFAGGEKLWLTARGDDISSVARTLWELQDVYPDGNLVQRVAASEPVEVPEEKALVRYRRFASRELMDLIAAGEVLPAGITRFVVSERILNVCLPLVHLKGGDLEERNQELREFVEDLQRQNRIRRYNEPVILFE